MKYKLDKLMCSLAIVSTLMPLTACQKKTENITLTRKNEIYHIINPLDWSKTPDYVNIETKDNYIIMDIDSFYRLLNTSDKNIVINGENKQMVLNKKKLEEEMEKELSNYNTPSVNDYLKVIITTIEGITILVLVNKLVAQLDKKEKIKKLS
ncbi:MAG: hypothetical protein IKF91_04810 [Bacilli bacterium]|nr:hypothetical protein [Bacilli bacterium]